MPPNVRVPGWILKPSSGLALTGSAVAELLDAAQIPTTEEQRSLLLDHLLLVKDLNDDVNLVSRSGVVHVLLKSLWESVAPLRDLSWLRGKQLLDLGSGGGFPGLPLAVLLPQTEVTLLDSRRAKTLALTSIVRELGMANTTVLHERAETLGEHDDRRYDTITARAVGLMKETLPWAAELLQPGGTFLTWKGPEARREFEEGTDGGWTPLPGLAVLPHREVVILERNRTP